MLRRPSQRATHPRPDRVRRTPRTLRTVASAAVALLAGVATLAVPSTGADRPVSAATGISASRTCAPSAASGTPPDRAQVSFTAITTQRIVDTRDGTGGSPGALGAGCTLVVTFGPGTVPNEATAVALSVTAITGRRGFVSAFACEDGRPSTSTLNTRAGVATANLAVAPLGTDRRVCLFTNQAGDLVVDLVGWWRPGPNRVGTVPPVRALDTRSAGGARVPAGSIRDVLVGGPYVPANSTAAIVNFTITDATRRGWAVVFPCGSPAPTVGSNVNVLTGESRAVQAIVGLGAAGAALGRLCVQSNVDVHVVIDVVGYYAPAPQFGPTADLVQTAAARLADSRDGTGGWTSRFRAGEVRVLDPVASSGRAAEASAVALNVVATNGASRGHLRVYPCTSAGPPNVSALNYPAAGPVTSSVSNLVVVELGSARAVCVYAHTPVDVVVDRVGVFAAPAGSLVERLSFAGVTADPRFFVGATDYGLRCPAPVNSIPVAVDPLPGVTVRIDDVPAPTGRATLTVPTDGLVRIQLTRPGQSRTYHFRCLPADFPVLAVNRPGNPAAGWYLTTFGQGNSPSGKFVAILDHYGAPVWYKRITTPRALVNLHRLADGTLAATDLGQFFGTTGDNLAHRLFDLSGNSVAVIRPDDPVNYPIDHHDVEFFPGGGRADVAYPLRTGVDLTDLGVGYSNDEWVTDGVIVEYDAAGDVVWDWSSVDAFAVAETTYPQRFNRYRPIVNGAEGDVDLVHINSIDLQPDGDYVVSARHLDNVFRIDRATGNLDWILRGSTRTLPTGNDGRVLTIVGDPFDGPLRPHDARLEGDVLTMFDNRTATAGPARAVAYRIDAVAMTATMLWQITESQGRPSDATGSTRVAPDGSVLVDWGIPIQPIFEEYTGGGDLLMQIALVPFGNSYRIIKYPAAAFNVGVLRATAGGALQAVP